MMSQAMCREVMPAVCSAKCCHGYSVPASQCHSKPERKHMIPCVSEWLCFLLFTQEMPCDPEEVTYVLSRVFLKGEEGFSRDGNNKASEGASPFLTTLRQVDKESSKSCYSAGIFLLPWSSSGS